MKLKDLARKSDALVFPSYFSDRKDIEKVNYIQSLNSKFNKLFSNVVISITYSSKKVKEELSKEVEKMYKEHFENIFFFHNGDNFGVVKSTCLMEEQLLKYCHTENFEMVCKSMDHVLILDEGLDIELDEDYDFYYTNGIGYGGCQHYNFKVEDIVENTFFPQTNFYFLNTKKVDYIYDLNLVEEKYLEWKDNNYKSRAHFIACEEETGKSIERNGLSKFDMIPRNSFIEIVKKVIHFNIHDPSFKNLSTLGIVHFQYPEQEIYKLV